jgi:hypothetical protein
MTSHCRDVALIRRKTPPQSGQAQAQDTARVKFAQ